MTPPPSAPLAEPLPEIPLTLLATSDLHGHLLSYDYFADCPAALPSLARLATVLRRERADAQNSLYFDNGDIVQGTAPADLFPDMPGTDALCHPSIEALNQLCPDAAAIGNHEFNLDLSDLSRAFGDATFPLVCANLHPTPNAPATLCDLWQESVILERDLTDTTGKPHRLKIGVFGVLPPQVVLWDHSRIGEALTSEDILTAAARAIARLRADGADLIVALAHTGLDTAPRRANMENAGFHLAALPGLDAVILGHTHLPFPAPNAPAHPAIDAAQGTVHGIPTVLPSAAAIALGRIDMTLQQEGNRWTVTTAKARLIDARNAPEDPELAAHLAPAHTRTLTAIRRPIGTLSRPLHSFFAPLPGSDALRLVAEAQATYLTDRLKGTALAGLPLLSAIAPQKAGGRSGPQHFTNVPAGPVALSHATDLQFFPNDIAVLRLTGADLADWLEMSAGFYQQITPDGGDQPLTNPAFPAYNCDWVFGVTYEIDLTHPARYAPDGTITAPKARRIRALCLDGAPLDPATDLLLAVNTYRAGGGGYFPHATPANTVYEETTKIRDIVADHIARTGGTPGAWPDPWNFTPIPGAAGLFDTSPKAAPLITTHPGLSATGQTKGGFLQLRIDLSA